MNSSVKYLRWFCFLGRQGSALNSNEKQPQAAKQPELLTVAISRKNLIQVVLIISLQLSFI